MEQFKHNNKDALVGIIIFTIMIIFMVLLAHLV